MTTDAGWYDDCLFCGWSVLVSETGIANAEDPVTCPDCGAVGHVEFDDSDDVPMYVTWDRCGHDMGWDEPCRECH